MDLVTNESESEWIWAPCSNNSGDVRGKEYLISGTLTTTIQLQSHLEQNIEVGVLTLNGQVVAQLYSGQITANTEHPIRFDAIDLQNGVYILQVINEQGQVYTDKLILQR